MGRGISPTRRGTTTISLGCVSPHTSSSRPARLRPACGGATPRLLGIAPGGVCREPVLPPTRGSSYLPFSPLPDPDGCRAIGWVLSVALFGGGSDTGTRSTWCLLFLSVAPLHSRGFPETGNEIRAIWNKRACLGPISRFSFSVSGSPGRRYLPPILQRPESGCQSSDDGDGPLSTPVIKSRLESGIWRLVSGVVSGRSSIQCPVSSFR